MLKLALISISWLFSCGLVVGDESTPKEDSARLTLERIYGSSDFSSKGFSGKWADTGHDYYLLEDSKQSPGAKDIVAYAADTNLRSVLVPGGLLIPNAESKPLNVESFTFSKDRSLVLIYTNSRRVWRQRTRGDYWLLDRSSRILRKLAPDARPSTTQFAKISPDAKKVGYVVDGNVFVEDVRSARVTQVTRKTNEKVINGTFDWVYEEEFGLRDGFRWSPDSQSLAYWQLDTTDVPVFTMINNTDTTYPRLIEFAHPKTGQTNSACRIGVVRLEHPNTTRWLSIEGDLRDNYIARMDWAHDSAQVVLQQFNRLQNTNHVILADRRSNNVSTAVTERDEAWVDAHDDLHWLKEGAEFTWISERDGWQHVYVISRDGEQTRLVTPGDFDVIALVHVNEEQDCIYFIASPDNATQRYLYRAKLDGSQVDRITPETFAGSNAYDISANGRYAVHTYSYAGMPPVTNLVTLPDHQVVRVLEDNKKLRERVEQLDQQAVEFFQIDIGNDVVMDAWCIKPPDMKAGAQYPLLCYVYGEPAGSTVTDRWGGNRYLWHLMMAQRGYIVISIDNRGTNVPRGRSWRKSIYRKVGIIAPKDQAAAVKKLIKTRSYIDPTRVGVWGWSGGGSMSLNAIFKYPDLYKTAISIAPVPNMRYYDTIYQERYMGLPSDNEQGYIEGSPINFAHQLQGNLLLVHGTGDDNCHYQTMEMLINELIHHNKQFSMMSYPNRTHAIREGKNTTLHLQTLMTEYLLENL